VKKSFYASLKPEQRAELDRRLIDSGWTGFDEHLSWLKSIGSEASKTVLIKYAEKYRAKLEDLKLQDDYRRAYQQEINDDIQVNAVNLIATAQRATQFLLDRVETRMKSLDDEVGDHQLAMAANTLSKVVGSIGTLNSSQVVNQKYLDEKRTKQEAKFEALAAEGQSAGISPEFMERMRKEVLNIE
jgi:Protein of unknown function (DUF3486)